MQLRIKADDHQLRERVRGMLSRLDAGETDVMRLVAEDFTKTAIATDPPGNDTNRYDRGWFGAGWDVGVRDQIAPPLQPSKYAAGYARAMREQIHRLEESLKTVEGVLQAWYPNGPPKNPRTPKYRQLMASKRKLTKRLAAAEARLAEYNPASSTIVMDAGKVVKDADGLPMFLGSQRGPTLRTNMPGGRGSITRLAEIVRLELEHLEPHANIIEKRYGVKRRASQIFKYLGGVNVTKKLRKDVFGRM